MYRIEFSQKAAKLYLHMDKLTQAVLRSFINKTLVGMDDSRVNGRPVDPKSQFLWRYESGKYRLICTFENDVLLIVSIRALEGKQGKSTWM